MARQTRLLLALGALLIAIPPTAQAQVPASADKPVARIDGVLITEKDIAIALEDIGATLPQMAEAQKREYVISYLSDLKVGAKAAVKAKLGDGPEFARRLSYFRDKVLVDELLAQETKKAVTPDAMRKLYDETVKALPAEQEVRARHILVNEEAEAKAILARVTTGKEDFAKVAGEVSKDPGSGKEGGDLGWFTKDKMVPEFADAAFKADAGKLTGPVKSQFGWHVIKVEEKRTKPVPPFEEVQEQVSQYLTRKTQTDLIVSLRESTKVERLDTPAASVVVPAPAPKQ